jgi:hypothetical protein
MPDNKRQHFVPRSILKHFTSDEDGKQINLINLTRRKIICGASLRLQCYRDYFYDKSLSLEKQIGIMEGHFSKLISDLIESNVVSSDLKTGRGLITFAALQRSRTLLAEEEINAMVDQISKLMMHGRVDRDVLEKAKIMFGTAL